MTLVWGDLGGGREKLKLFQANTICQPLRRMSPRGLTSMTRSDAVKMNELRIERN